ncbi:hypothetical protein K0M31_003405 [Melipona bicolor]|uniref:Uncharacterized protein n=1 Tax=Melipona bicolor TaxID=60889 RepID=A0AA40FZ42_9HYME|nr:hypothetical protein K0M31_003405 [Melipona bicolor]
MYSGLPLTKITILLLASSNSNHDDSQSTVEPRDSRETWAIARESAESPSTARESLRPETSSWIDKGREKGRQPRESRDQDYPGRPESWQIDSDRSSFPNKSIPPRAFRQALPSPNPR